MPVSRLSIPLFPFRNIVLYLAYIPTISEDRMNNPLGGNQEITAKWSFWLTNGQNVKVLRIDPR